MNDGDPPARIGGKGGVCTGGPPWEGIGDGGGEGKWNGGAGESSSREEWRRHWRKEEDLLEREWKWKRSIRKEGGEDEAFVGGFQLLQLCFHRQHLAHSKAFFFFFFHFLNHDLLEILKNQYFK